MQGEYSSCPETGHRICFDPVFFELSSKTPEISNYKKNEKNVVAKPRIHYGLYRFQDTIEKCIFVRYIFDLPDLLPLKRMCLLRRLSLLS